MNWGSWGRYALDADGICQKQTSARAVSLHEASLWYELIITAPDGVTRVERYTERAAMLRRQHELLTRVESPGLARARTRTGSRSHPVTRPPHTIDTKIHDRFTKIDEDPQGSAKIQHCMANLNLAAIIEQHARRRPDARGGRLSARQRMTFARAERAGRTRSPAGWLPRGSAAAITSRCSARTSRIFPRPTSAF